MVRIAIALFFLNVQVVLSQATLTFHLEDVNSLIQAGTVPVSHSAFDIGSIYDVFDHDPGTLARSANINPLMITISFPFPVYMQSSSLIHSGGTGWWTLEAADSQEDLYTQGSSYVSLFEMRNLPDGIKSTQLFGGVLKKVFRMTVMRTSGDNYVHLNEWDLIEAAAQVEIVDICTRPSTLYFLPTKMYSYNVIGVDALGYDYAIDNGLHSISDNNLVIPTGVEFEELLALDTTGITELITTWSGLTDTAQLIVTENFKPKPAPTREVSVALVIINPPIAAEGGLRFHERFGWDDPMALTNALVDSLNAVSEGVVHYNILETYDESELYADFQGMLITVDSIYRLFLEPGWTTFHQLEQIGGAIQFDYNALLDAHGFCNQSNAGEIDEVWVYSMPFTGMYESRLTGDGAFWYNSPPLDGNDCTDQLPIMGFNYERGVAEAMHSFGHRVESAMAHTFGRWDNNAVDKNDWELFSHYYIGSSTYPQCGNIHFPPNGESDYDYGNNRLVFSGGLNWKYYPFFFNDFEPITCAAWGCSHLGYMSWWFRHLPHFSCLSKDGRLNNWWSYIVDYNEGKSLEAAQHDCDCDYAEIVTASKEIDKAESISIYPNPTTGKATLDFHTFRLPVNAIHVFDAKGHLLKVYEHPDAGAQKQIDLGDLPAGQYFIRVISGDRTVSPIYPVVLVRS